MMVGGDISMVPPPAPPPRPYPPPPSQGSCFDGLNGNGTCHCVYDVTSGFFVGADCSLCPPGIWGSGCLSTCPGLDVQDFLRLHAYNPAAPGLISASPGLTALICHGHGSCRDGRSSNGQCDCVRSFVDGFWDGPCDQCLKGYWGPQCRAVCHPVENPGNPCSGGGVCNDGVGGDGSCTCDAAHAGVGCEKYVVCFAVAWHPT